MDITKRPRKNGLCASFRCALEGLYYVLGAERNARIHATIALCVILLSVWLRLNLTEWALIIVAIALVFAGEMLNTVVELTVDMITSERHPTAKRAKDVAAGAVLVATLAAVMIGLFVLGPLLWNKIARVHR